MISLKNKNKRTVRAILNQQEFEGFEKLKECLDISSSQALKLGLEALWWAYLTDHLGDIADITSRPLAANSGSDSLDRENETVDLGTYGTYKIAKIGNQTWLAENYRPYKSLGNDIDWFSWSITQREDFCPKGWRIPTVADFEKLTAFAELNSCLGFDWMEGLCRPEDEWGFNADKLNHFWTADRDESNKEFAKEFILTRSMTAVDNAHISDYNSVRLIKCAD